VQAAQTASLSECEPLFVDSIDVQLGSLGFRPNVAAWRRERVPAMPKERPVSIPPDWICEILSESNATTDTVRKLRRYDRRDKE
jgi:Uma2 family endonuclease